MATPAQERVATETMETIGRAVVEIVAKAEMLGFPAPLGIVGCIGALAALAKAHGMKRENVHGALDTAWGDMDAGDTDTRGETP